MGKTKPIITDDMHVCILEHCNRTDIEWHHCIGGNPGRKLSDKYGLVVPLCVEHHRGNTGVHKCRAVDLKIKQLAQTTFEKKVGSREEWMKIFGRNYL